MRAANLDDRFTALSAIPSLPHLPDVERAEVMRPEDDSSPEIFREFSALLGNVTLEKLNRPAFYAACCAPDLQLAISTGEARIFANILLTVGVA